MNDTDDVVLREMVAAGMFDTSIRAGLNGNRVDVVADAVADNTIDETLEAQEELARLVLDADRDPWARHSRITRVLAEGLK